MLSCMQKFAGSQCQNRASCQKRLPGVFISHENCISCMNKQLRLTNLLLSAVNWLPETSLLNVSFINHHSRARLELTLSYRFGIFFKIQSIPDNSNLPGKWKKFKLARVRVIGSSKQITGK